MAHSDQFRRNAEEAKRWAEQARTEDARVAYRALAEAWSQWADQVDHKDRVSPPRPPR